MKKAVCLGTMAMNPLIYALRKLNSQIGAVLVEAAA